MKKLFIFMAILVGVCITTEISAQAGGRKREHRNQRRASMNFFRNKSMGNADKFARGAGKKGIISRLFKKDRPAWVYRPTNPGKQQKRESRYLFSRYRTSGKKMRAGILARQNAERARYRSRGNATFHKSRYN